MQGSGMGEGGAARPGAPPGAYARPVVCVATRCDLLATWRPSDLATALATALATWRPAGDRRSPGDTLRACLLCWQPTGYHWLRPGNLATYWRPTGVWRLLLATWRPGAQPGT
eukprot:5990448-Prymnesium_polylepis.1